MTLRVKVEIVPSGDEDNTYELGRLDIFNKNRINFDHYEYGCIELDTESNKGGLYNQTVYHKRDEGFWVLVSKVLNELVLVNLGHLTQEKGKNMNDNLNTPEFKPVPVKLTDAEVEKLLAAKPLDGTAAYLTDADETADEPTPTIN